MKTDLKVIPLEPMPYIGKYNSENYNLMKPFAVFTKQFQITDSHFYPEVQQKINFSKHMEEQITSLIYSKQCKQMFVFLINIDGTQYYDLIKNDGKQFNSDHYLNIVMHPFIFRNKTGHHEEHSQVKTSIYLNNNEQSVQPQDIACNSRDIFNEKELDVHFHYTQNKKDICFSPNNAIIKVNFTSPIITFAQLIKYKIGGEGDFGIAAVKYRFYLTFLKYFQVMLSETEK